MLYYANETNISKDGEFSHRNLSHRSFGTLSAPPTESAAHHRIERTAFFPFAPSVLVLPTSQQWSFHKTGTMGTLESRAEIADWVKHWG